MRRFLTVVILAAGCSSSSTESCGDPPTVAGNWSYAGREETPQPSSFEGNVILIAQSCGELAGQADLLEVSDLGLARRLTGPLAGRQLESGSIRLDVIFGPETRQHVGQLSGSVITGSWVLPGTSDLPTRSGTFTLTRQN